MSVAPGGNIVVVGTTNNDCQFPHGDVAAVRLGADTAVDTAPPTVTIASPAIDAKYTRGQVVNAAYACADVGLRRRVVRRAGSGRRADRHVNGRDLRIHGEYD